MKRFLSLFMICLITMGLLCSVPVSADGTLSVTAGSASVTVDKTVTVTVTYNGGNQPIGAIVGTLKYDTNVFSYVSFSGSGVEVNGGAGVVKYLYYASGAQAPTKLTVTFTFKAVAPGSCDFKAETEEFANDTDYASLGTPSGSVTVTANNPTLSGNADLKSLVPSKGTLRPKFDPSVTEYVITVYNSVTSISLSAVAAEGKVTNISGKNALEVGENVRVITVTAPNGTTKKYTVKITRLEESSTTAGTDTDSSTTTTTLPLPPDDALAVSVDGKPMTIMDTQAAGDLPEGFAWGNVTVNLVEVPAAIHATTGMTLLYLTAEDEADNGFYIYRAEEDSFARFRPLAVAQGSYLLYDLPSGKAPYGTSAALLDYGDGTVSAFFYRDAALSDFCIVWAAPFEGEADWYTYDRKEGTLQRYHVPTVEETVTTTQTNTTTAKPTAADSSAASGGVLENYRKPLLIGFVAIAALAAITIIVVLILSSGGRKKGKH